MFLDSDDYYKSKMSLKHLYDTIVNRRFPDLVKLGYEQVSGTHVSVYRFKGNCLKNVVGLCAPWTSCIKTTLCPKFVENRIRFNDVVWSLRAYDVSKTLAIVDEPIVVYTTNDNPNSCQHSKIDA